MQAKADIDRGQLNEWDGFVYLTKVKFLRMVHRKPDGTLHSRYGPSAASRAAYFLMVKPCQRNFSIQLSIFARH